MANPLRAALAAALAALVLGLAAPPALAQVEDEQTYDEKILRLAEILGAIHHLRDICGANEGQLWRDQMLQLLKVEDPPGQLRARLIAAFNNGYQGYQRTYAACTTTAKTAADRFFTEGSEIATSLALRLAEPPAEGEEEEEDGGAGSEAPAAAGPE